MNSLASALAVYELQLRSWILGPCRGLTEDFIVGRTRVCIEDPGSVPFWLTRSIDRSSYRIR